jgi:hypothetical protein
MSEVDDETGEPGTIVMDGDGGGELVNIHEAPPVGGRTFTLDELNALGMPVPLADPDVMREAYAFRRRMVASILDREHDFLYTITYVEQNKTREKMTTSYAEALKFSEMYKVPYKAVPKKSGVAKLATAFNIEGRIIEQKGLPIDDKANYSYIVYEVTHKATGKKAIGVGFARATERGYAMPEHHMIGLADTRALSRAILRITGFGEAGAEEIGGNLITTNNVRLEMGARRALPAEVSAEVIDVHRAEETRIPVVTQRAVQAPAPAQAVPVQATPTQAKPATTPAPVTQAAPAAPPEVLMPHAPVITEAQVGKLSVLLGAKLGSRERAVNWLKAEAHVETTRKVREADYPGLLAKLEAMEVP